MKKINILLPILVFLPLTSCSSGSFNPNDNQPDATLHSDDFYYSVSNDKVTLEGFTTYDDEVTIPKKIDGKVVFDFSNNFLEKSFDHKIHFEDGFDYESILLKNYKTNNMWKLITRSTSSMIVDYNYDELNDDYYQNVKVVLKYYSKNSQETPPQYLPENTMRIKSGVLDYINNDLDKYTTYLDGAYYFGSQSNPYLCLFKFDDSNASSFNILPDTKLIYSSAFKNSNLSSIYIPENIVSIWESVFENCSNLKTVEFAANSLITTLEYSLFKNCNNLEYVKNTNNILKIDSRVFEGCTNLKEFVLPDNIESVGNSILYNGNKNLFTKFENGYYLGTKTNPYLWLVDLENKDISTLTINKDTKYLAPYSCAYTTKLKELIVPSNIEEIGHGAFYNSKALEKVTFEEGVKKINDKAFMRSENLKQTKFTNTINTLGEAVFAYCTNLDNINIPSSIFNLSNDLFNNCLSLKNLTIPNSIKYIGTGCFYLCNSLNKVTLPKSLLELDNFSFSACYGLTEFTIPNSIRYIGEYALEASINITKLNVPFFSRTNSLDSQQIYMNYISGFYSKLNELTITENDIYLDKNFKSYHYLKILNLPEKIKYIAPDVFNKTTIEEIRYAVDEKTWNELIKDVNKADLAKINVTFGKK